MLKGFFFIFNIFSKINSKCNTVAFLFSNLTLLAAPKSVAWPKHVAAPHASTRHDLPRGTTISTWKSSAAPLPLAWQHCSTAPARLAWQGATLEKLYFFSYDLG